MLKKIPEVSSKSACNSTNSFIFSAVSMLGGALKKKKMGKLGAVMEKIELPYETDPVKLCTYVCGSNIYKTGEDTKIKPDSEYPEWLWNLRLGPKPPLEELEPGSREYWKRIRKLGLQRNNKILKIKRMKALNSFVKTH